MDKYRNPLAVRLIHAHTFLAQYSPFSPHVYIVPKNNSYVYLAVTVSAKYINRWSWSFRHSLLFSSQTQSAIPERPVAMATLTSRISSRRWSIDVTTTSYFASSNSSRLQQTTTSQQTWRHRHKTAITSRRWRRSTAAHRRIIVVTRVQLPPSWSLCGEII